MSVTLLITGSIALCSSDQEYVRSGQAALDYLAETGDCDRCDLSGQDLRQAIIAYQVKRANAFIQLNRPGIISLCYANLARAIMTDLSVDVLRCGWSNMQGIDMSGMHLNEGSFVYANLTDAQMQDMHIVNQGDFSGAQCQNANMQNIHIGQPKFFETDMQGVDAFGADIPHADMRCANIAGAIFDEANLNGALMDTTKGIESASFVGTLVDDIDAAKE